MSKLAWYIVMVVLLTILLAIGLTFASMWIWPAHEGADAQTPDELYMDVPYDSTLLALDKKALDEAYHDQVKHLWDIWLRGQARGTQEISNGLRLARSSYNVAVGQIAKREQRQR